ncbi:hypothetical protein FCM35_KLT13628 [Carex littledalei]|uniref:CCHC-type domain-containing protein n=1 Tax=Carex littledalei TaxID=544730 RepID=A0A833QPL0_9POAL|nr:hypothetical protein FCM35_KLT13628 [Carex littledalei]
MVQGPPPKEVTEQLEHSGGPHYDLVHPYIPFFSKKSYAQAVSGSSVASQSASGGSMTNITSPQNSRPNSPPTPTHTQYYSSPHSSTTLRFPPQPAFLEWRGRCFCCLRVGHSASKCCNKLRCGRCWKEGHVVSKCTAPALNPLAKPFIPAKSNILIDRDAAYYVEIEKLSKAVVIHSGSHTPVLQLEQVVRIAVDTGLVREEEIRVAKLARERTLIHLSRGLKVDTFIRALPASLWDQGFNIQPWSETEGAEVKMPRFKVLIDLVDFPIQMWRENKVKKAVSGIGIYLGIIQPEKKSGLIILEGGIGHGRPQQGGQDNRDSYRKDGTPGKHPPGDLGNRGGIHGKDMVMSDDQQGSQNVNGPISKAAADRKEAGERVTAQRAARRRHNKPIIPYLSILFREDQHHDASHACVQAATKYPSDSPVLPSAIADVPRVLERNLKKQPQAFETGQSLVMTVTDQAVGEHGNNTELAQGDQPQQIQLRTKESISSKNQGKRMLSQPAYASRHTRFATLVGQGK